MLMSGVQPVEYIVLCIVISCVMFVMDVIRDRIVNALSSIGLVTA